MKYLYLSAALAVMLGFSTQANSHHSFPATYMVEDTTTIEGTLVAFLYRNPHATIQVLVTEDDGEQRRYLVEWAGASALAGTGVNRTTLTAGDHVIVTGNPGRNAEDRRVLLRSIDRPADGWHWSGEFQ